MRVPFTGIAISAFEAIVTRMITISVNQAASQFTDLISLIGEGEEVVVVDQEQPVARIIRCETTAGDRPLVGTITSGPVRYSEDCFAPLSDDELKTWGL